MKTRMCLHTVACALLLIVIGCAPAPALQAGPTLSGESSSVPTSTAIPTTQVAPTRLLATPFVAPPRYTWRDDFNGVLASGWAWVDEDRTHWSLQDTPGALQIMTEGESPTRAGKPKNLLFRDAPANDFEIMTKVTFNPQDNFQQAAILIYQDDDNIVLLNRGFCGVRGCPGSGVFLDNMIKDQLDFGNHPQMPVSSTTTWLRLRKEGTEYIGFYSIDGQIWEELGRVENLLTARKLGLTARNSSTDPYAPQIPADFDFLTVQGLTPGE
jgi:beta-xylosidase